MIYKIELYKERWTMSKQKPDKTIIFRCNEFVVKFCEDKFKSFPEARLFELNGTKEEYVFSGNVY